MATSNIQLAIACERLRTAIAKSESRQDAIARKWVAMALESSQKRAMRMARGKV